MRHNQLYRNKYAANGEFIEDEFITDNHAIMMYEPMLSDGM
jgi:vancomycin resistance protein VanW